MCVDGSSLAKRLAPLLGGRDGVALRLLWTIRVQVDPWLDSSEASVWCLPSLRFQTPPPPQHRLDIVF